MHLNTLFLFVSLLFLSLPALLGQEYFVYVASESEDEVALVSFDGETAKVEKTIPVGYIPTEIEGPHGMTVSPDGKHWYLSMAHGTPYGKLYKFQTGVDQLVAETQLGLFPASMQISKATGLLYVVNFNLHGKMTPSSVSVVDPERMQEIKRVETGAMPHGSRISANGLYQYSVAMMSGELFEISTTGMKVSRKLMLDPTPETHSAEHAHPHHMKDSHEGHKMKHSKVKPTWVIPHPLQDKVFIAGNGSDEIIEVDTKAWAITHRLAGGKGPYNVEITPDGQRLVVTYKSEATTGIWDLSTRKELARVPNSRKVSHGIALSPDGKYAFVSVEGIGAEPGAVDVIDIVEGKRVAVAEVGKQAGGIAFWKMAP